MGVGTGPTAQEGNEQLDSLGGPLQQPFESIDNRESFPRWPYIEAYVEGELAVCAEIVIEGREIGGVGGFQLEHYVAIFDWPEGFAEAYRAEARVWGEQHLKEHHRAVRMVLNRAQDNRHGAMLVPYPELLKQPKAVMGRRSMPRRERLYLTDLGPQGGPKPPAAGRGSPTPRSLEDRETDLLPPALPRYRLIWQTPLVLHGKGPHKLIQRRSEFVRPPTNQDAHLHGGQGLVNSDVHPYLGAIRLQLSFESVWLDLQEPLRQRLRFADISFCEPDFGFDPLAEPGHVEDTTHDE